jgi:Protein of unknown function (DUF1592)/Protein of unknown function (DUF1588)/Protein of unknown function (DUF1585)/Protein of unknown function (DUF1587)/Protein of unknown function (DUF1595)/Planctomycete cytochrome C
VHSKSFFCSAFILASVLSVRSFGADPLPGFLKTYCIECHGETHQKGDRRLDQLTSMVTSEDQQVELRDIVDQLVLGEMPPRKAKQPTADLRKQIIELLTSAVEAAKLEKSSTDSQTVLRRMNRREYLNTVRDLFGVDMSMFDPTTKFPRDQTVGHLDNVGDKLVTSSFLLKQYLEAADAVIEKVFKHSQRPDAKTWTFNQRFKQQPELDSAHAKAFDNRYLCLYECSQSEQPEGAFGPLLEFREGVPCDGLYEVRVLVEGKNRINKYDARIMGVDPSDPFRMAVVPGNPKLDRMHVAQLFHQPLAETVVADGGPHWYTFKVPLDEGFSPRFTFPNGMLSIRSAYSKLANQHKALLPPEGRKILGGIVGNRIALLSFGQIPHLRIHEVVVRGPLAESPALPIRRIQNDQVISEEHVSELLERFASRAYRRPAKPEEITDLLSVYQRRRKQGLSVENAFQDGLKASLCAPGFLYLEPIVEADSPNLVSQHAVASRLAYFIWSSMPDDELRELADRRELQSESTLRLQVRRMLADPKANAFVESFLDSWLNLRALGDMPPAREEFAKYYSQNLEESMRKETQLFLKHLINKNESILDCIDSDYSYVDRPLAKLYGIEGQVPPDNGEQFRLIRFTDPNRGGLLGQASVLTVTANGIETSPVIRGVWLLENILGTPPSPPPDDVPAIDPDVRGATSMRDLLVKHRDSPTCMECHRKIDPLGFALENFDPIGAWRTHYDKKIEIDSSGELPSGEMFKNVAGLKKVLMQRKEFFARMLTEKLVAYACGRTIESRDRPAIEKICEPLREKGYPMRELIEAVVTSDLFLSP